ncbi:hypothetical protein WAE61_00550 [Comamonadaceae bacterium PP-2]
MPRNLPWTTSRLAGALRDAGPALLLLVLGLAGLVAATLSPSGRDGAYAILVPPWGTTAQALEIVGAAGGRIAEVSASGTSVIAIDAAPDFEARLYDAGAWMVVEPGTNRGCSSSLNRRAML